MPADATPDPAAPPFAALTVGLGDARVRIDASGPLSVAAAAWLRRAAADDEDDAPVRLALRDVPGGARLEPGPAAPLPTLGAAADALIAAVGFHLVDQARAGLVLHAGAVGRGERLVALIAPSARGKSTLAAWLAGQGLDWCTDELLFLGPDAPAVEGFARPAKLRHRALEALRAAGLDPPGALPTPAGAIVDPRALGAPTTPRRGVLVGAVLVDWARGAAPALTPLSRPEAAAALLRAGANHRHLPGHGLAETVALARAVPCWRLTYGGFAEVAALWAAVGG